MIKKVKIFDVEKKVKNKKRKGKENVAMRERMRSAFDIEEDLLDLVGLHDGADCHLLDIRSQWQQVILSQP